MNAATELVDSRWLTADSSTITTTTDNTSSATSTLPSSANPLWSQPFAADRDPVGVVDAEDDRGAEDPAEELPDPVADRFTRRELPRQVERQAEDRVGDGADHADRDRDGEAEAEGGLERADRLAAEDDETWTAEHHDGRSGELGGNQSDCAELGHVGERTLGLCSASSPVRRLASSIPTFLCSLPSCRKQRSSRGTIPRSTGDIVVKPSVGAGSIGVRRFEDDPAGAHHHIDVLHARGVVAMVQQYVSAVDTHGETGMVFIGGTFSHAFRKESILASPVEWEASEGQQGMFARERTEAKTPSGAEVAVAERVVASLPVTAYARVDLLPTGDGPVLLELEVIEPSLFLHLDPAFPRAGRCRLP